MAINIQEEILNNAGKEMAREIDREVLWSMLVGIGWTRVVVPAETAMVKATLIKEWLEINCANPYEKNRGDFIFEDKKDATLFVLKWL
jgi:hypothetical protein